MLTLEKCNKPGILLVLTRPTSLGYVSEIEDWYDTEHGPARLRLGKEYFSRGCRFRLVSDSSTAWLAMYEMRSLSAGARDPYTSLRANRSLREQEIFRGKLEVRSRRFLRSLADSGSTSRTADMIYVISFEASGREMQLGEWYCNVREEINGLPNPALTMDRKCSAFLLKCIAPGLDCSSSLMGQMQKKARPSSSVSMSLTRHRSI